MSDEILTENAKKILKERYLKRDEEGNVVETPEEMFKRVATDIAEVNEKYDDDRTVESEEKEFYDALINLDFIPNSPTLMNAGLELGQLSACFVLSPQDDMDSIFQQVKNAAKIFQSGGGVGYTFSRLRPRGDTVKSTGGVASGPVSFMKVYDEMCNTIKQGGCLAEDERVMTTDGYIPIREIHNGRPNSDAPSKGLVRTKKGFNQVIQTNDSGEMDVHTIKTEDGYSIRAVYEHPFLSVNDEGKLEFKRADELKEDDIIVFDQSDKLVDTRQSLNETDKEYHHNAQIAENLPDKVTDDLARFLGLLWADGAFDTSNDRLVFSLAKDRDEKDWIVETVSSWGLNVRVIDQKEKEKGDYWRVVIQSQHLMDWMRENRLEKDITQIPEAIYRSPIAIPAFLGGFTADANISKDANTVCYSTAYKRTAENLQELLLLCGISSKIMRVETNENRYSDKERFEVRVNPGRSANLFEEKIPHFLNGEVGDYGGQRQNKVYFADKLVNRLLDDHFIKNNKLPEEVDRKAMKELRRYERGERIPSRKRLVEVLEKVGITDVPELSENNLFQKISYNEEDSRAGVADIEVLHSSHNYIAGNAIVHNKRRGAQMGVLSVQHPDIEEFIEAKDEEGELENFNISVALTEEFMEAVRNGEDYDLINPRNGEVEDQLDAEEIYDKIVNQAWKNGEPGILFLDRVNEDNPFDIEEYPDHYIDATNPCGEQPLEDFEACNLGHINLSHAVQEGEVDWEHLEEMLDLSVRFLDNVIDASDFPNVKGYEGEENAIRKKVNENRKIGLGVMGWHNMLMQLEIPYDSEEAIDKAHEVMEFIQEKSKKASKKIAEERGKFPNWDESEYEEPMRNATTTTIAPTGTTSMIANTSGGIEPVFAVSYIKNVLDGETLVMPDPVFEDFAKERGFYDEELMENIAKQGSVTDIDEVPEDIKPLFKTALEISPEWHIRMQAAFQEHVDNAISKTVNFPNEASKEDIKEVYDLAYDLKCKGVTVYRSGSRQEQVMEVEGEKEEETLERRPRERPTTVEGTTQKIDTGYGGLYVTINEDEYGLFEVFSQIGRAGGFTQSFTESLARLISLSLRSGIPPEEIIEQLEGIRSPEVAFEEGEKILSIPDAMAKALKWHKEGKKRTEQAQLPTEENDNESSVEKMVAQGINPACPDCGAMLTLSEGCVTCPNCGYSQC